MMRTKSVRAMVWCLWIPVLALAGAGAAAQASPGDGTTPAGVGVGSVVIFAPVAGTAQGIVMPRGMILIPTPATGSLVLPVPVAPASGAGPSIVRYVLVIPGPNPAQNTGVALGQQLRIELGANGQVTVYPIPGP